MTEKGQSESENIAVANGRFSLSFLVRLKNMYGTPQKADDGWETVHSSDGNLDASLIKCFFDKIMAQADCSMHGVLLVRHNNLVVEE